MKKQDIVYTFEDIKSFSSNKKEILWNNISQKQLELLYINNNLSDKVIADLFNIDKSKVKYKRRKYNIKFNDKIIKAFLDNIPDDANIRAKEYISKNYDIDKFAKVITHFAFRNGPIEDMHANNQLSQKDMMILNKYMVNRIAGILTLIKENQWFKLEALIEMNKCYGTDWDKAEPDIKDIDYFIKAISGCI